MLMENDSRPGFRDQIVLAAVALVMEIGEDGLTMRALASRLKVSPAALYQCYESKGEILRDIRFYGASRLWQAFEEHLGVTDAYQRIKHFFATYFEFSRNNAWLYSLMMRADPEQWQHLDPTVPMRAQRPLRACEEAIAQLVDAGRMPAGVDPRRAAVQIWAAVHGMCSLLLPGATLDRNPFLPIADLESFVDQFVDAILCGIAGGAVQPAAQCNA
jgi:AcrR family transcriptional regulator